MGGALPIIGAVFSVMSAFGGLGGGMSEPPPPTPMPVPPTPAPIPVVPVEAPKQDAIQPLQAADLEAAKARDIRRNSVVNITPTSLISQGVSDTATSTKNLTGS